MRVVAEGIWEQRSSCRFKGFWLSRRMTVVRLASGGLWLHSPGALTPLVREELDALGSVEWVVAPNTHHHAHLEDYLRAYTDAQLYAAPGLPEKRSDLRIDGLLTPGAELPWSEELDTAFVAGMPLLNESVFFHRASETLIVTDLLFCFGPQDPWKTRLLGRLDGTYGRPGLSRHARWNLLQDRAAFARSLEQIAAWPAKRLLMAHAQDVVALDPAALKRALT